MNINRVVEMVHIQASHLCEKSHLIPNSYRDLWLNYLDRHLDHYASIISRLPPPESCGPILEIGCMPGHLTFMMANLGYKVSCVDINPERLSEFWKANAINVHQVNYKRRSKIVPPGGAKMYHLISI